MIDWLLAKMSEGEKSNKEMAHANKHAPLVYDN